MALLECARGVSKDASPKMDNICKNSRGTIEKSRVLWEILFMELKPNFKTPEILKINELLISRSSKLKILEIQVGSQDPNFCTKKFHFNFKKMLFIKNIYIFLEIKIDVLFL